MRLESLLPMFSRKKSIKEVAFKEAAAAQSVEITRWNMWVNCASQTVLLVLRGAMMGVNSGLVTWEVMLAQGVLALLPVLYLSTLRWWGRRQLPAIVQVASCLLISILSVFDLIFCTEYDHELTAIQLLYLHIVTTWSTLTFYRVGLVLAGIVCVVWIVLAAEAPDWEVHFTLLAFIVAFVCVNCYSIYVRERQLRLYAELKKVEEKEIAKNEKLLAQMMPRSVYEKLKQDLPVTDRLRNMSILFADIVGFTNWSSNKSPEEVVGMLSALFTQFDLLCVRFKIYKVHTIGDCYVVMGFDGASDAFDPSMGCLRLFCMGYEMIRTIKEVNEREGIDLNMRIGIHTGEVIAGITGRDVVRYDIYGSAVMVANKMESGGSAGKVNVSEVTREVLERVAPGLLEYSNNQEIEAKSIGKRFMSYFATVTDEEKLMALVDEP